MGRVLVPYNQGHHSQKPSQKLSKAKKMTQEIENCAVNLLPSSNPTHP